MSLFDITTYSSVIFTLLGGYFLKKISSKPLRLLIIYRLFQTVADLLLIYVFQIGDGTLIRVAYSVLKPLEYGCYAYLIHDRVKSSFSKRYAWITVMLFIALSGLQLIISQGYQSKIIATNIVLLEGVLTLVLVLLYFQHVLSSKSTFLLSEDPVFWIATGLLFFYSGNIVATGFYHQLKKYSVGLANGLYQLNYILNLVNYILTGFAFFISTKMIRSHVR